VLDVRHSQYRHASMHISRPNAVYTKTYRNNTLHNDGHDDDDDDDADDIMKYAPKL